MSDIIVKIKNALINEKTNKYDGDKVFEVSILLKRFCPIIKNKAVSIAATDIHIIGLKGISFFKNQPLYQQSYQEYAP